MSSSLNEQFYFTPPVQAALVTTQNMEEVAQWCGGKVVEIESKRRPGQKDRYVWVPTPEGSKITDAFPGMFVTRRVTTSVRRNGHGVPRKEIKMTWAVFHRDYFEANYFETPIEAVNTCWGGGHKTTEIPRTKRIFVNNVQNHFNEVLDTDLPASKDPEIARLDRKIDMMHGPGAAAALDAAIADGSIFSDSSMDLPKDASL